MKATKIETTNEMTQSEVMNKLYRALTLAQAQIILHLRDAVDEEDRKARATDIIEKLETFSLIPFVQQCGNGTIWNPITQQCE